MGALDRCRNNSRVTTVCHAAALFSVSDAIEEMGDNGTRLVAFGVLASA